MSSLLLNILIYLNLIVTVISEENELYIFNEDGEDCSYAEENPTSEFDCTRYHTENISCCFAVITKQDNTTENKCWPIQRNLRYFVNYLNIFNYSNYKYINIKAQFYCNQIDQTCGIDSPKELYECSEHSSKSKSCCLLTTPTQTNCIMSQTKFNDGTNISLFEGIYIICSDYFLYSKIIYILLIAFLL